MAIRVSHTLMSLLSFSCAPPSTRSCSYTHGSLAISISISAPLVAKRMWSPIISSATTAPSSNARGSSIMRLPTTTELINLKMPFVQCSFPAQVHADYDAVKDACDAWIEEVAEPHSVNASRFLQACLLPLLGSQFIPKAISRGRLVHVIKVIAWLIIADDDDDHPDVLGSNYATTSHRAGLVMAILRSSNSREHERRSFLASTPPTFPSKSLRMLRALAALWDEIRIEMPGPLQARFTSAMADYLEAVKVQASFREEVTIPNAESYMGIRRQASFLFPCFVLMEYAYGIELEKATFNRPLVRELRTIAADYISLCNDIVSSPIEVRMGDYFNLPSILYNSALLSPQGLTSFQSAMDCVAKMAQDLNNRAVVLISAIHAEESRDVVPPPPIHAYVDGLSLCMSGSCSWYYESARYQQASGWSELLETSVREMANR